MTRLRPVVAGLVLAVPLLASGKSLRPRFEPTDLELELPGVVEVDLQAGFVQSPGPYRFVLPDVEVDIGVLPNVELDVDWTYAIEQPFDHSTQDNVWLSAKIGIFDVRDAKRASSWAAGVQLGPRFGAAPGARGVGAEALLLVAYARPHLQLVLNAGGLVDPPVDQARPLGLETGLNLSFDLDRRGIYSLTAAVGGVAYFSRDSNQILVSLGFGWAVTDKISLSLTALTGFLDGGDRVGVLIGYSQKLVSARARP